VHSPSFLSSSQKLPKFGRLGRWSFISTPPDHKAFWQQLFRVWISTSERTSDEAKKPWSGTTGRSKRGSFIMWDWLIRCPTTRFSCLPWWTSSNRWLSPIPTICRELGLARLSGNKKTWKSTMLDCRIEIEQRIPWLYINEEERPKKTYIDNIGRTVISYIAKEEPLSEISGDADAALEQKDRLRQGDDLRSNSAITGSSGVRGHY